MPPSIVQCDYQQMESVAKRFQVQAEQTEQLLQQVRDRADRLCDGNWIGRAGEAFQDEMERLVFPALQRMIAALQEASSVTTQISETMRQAEEEAAALFQVQGAGGSSASDGLQGAQDWWKRWGETVHATLDTLGFIPVYGEIADGANALIYLAEGRYAEAAVSAVAMVPLLGDAAKGGKWATKLGMRFAKEGAERGAKEVGEQVAKKATKASYSIPEKGFRVNKHHDITESWKSIKKGSKGGKTTINDGSFDMKADVDAINRGQANPVKGNQFEINGRVYGHHNNGKPGLFPVSGPGTTNLNNLEWGVLRQMRLGNNQAAYNMNKKKILSDERMTELSEIAKKFPDPRAGK